MNFLLKYEDADDSKAAEKECKVISSVKNVQKACKKVVKDVLKKDLDALDSCKAYDWCPAPRTRARRIAECVCEDEPTSEPTSNRTPKPTNKQADEPTLAPTINNSPNCAPTSLPTGNPTRNPTSNPTNSPTEHPTGRPTDHPTLVPTDPKPDEDECGECVNFLANYNDADDSKAAEKECKVMSNDKVVQKACKKVVKDVLKKGKATLDTCKTYGWCRSTRTRAFLRARRTAECDDDSTISPTNAHTSNPSSNTTNKQTNQPTFSPTNNPTEHPTPVPTSPKPIEEYTYSPTAHPRY